MCPPLPSDGPDDERRLIFQVSILAAYYLVFGFRYNAAHEDGGNYRDGRFDLLPYEQPYANELAREIQATYGAQSMPPEVGRLIVPEIELDGRLIGEVTVYDCLF